MKIQNIKPAKTKKLLKQILLGAVVFLFSLNSNAADYYWVGGTGNWSDFANHWATTSGGTTFHTVVPSPADNVFFDANSFSSSGQAANLDITPAYCKNFDWQNTVMGADFITPGQLNTVNIFNSLNIGADITFNGIFSFIATTSGNTVSISDTLDCILDFNNASGSWLINSPIVITNEMTLRGGTLNTNNFNITTTRFRSDYGTPGRTLIPGTSVFNLACSFQSAWADWWIDNELSFNGANTDLNFMILPNTPISGAYFRLINFYSNASNCVYRNLNFDATLDPGNPVLHIESDLIAHSLQTHHVLSVFLSVNETFQVDTVILTDSITAFLTMVTPADTINVDVNYWESEGTLSLWKGNVDKMIHYGDMAMSGGLYPQDSSFMRDVYVSGNFFSFQNGDISIGKLVIGGGAETSGLYFVDTMMIGLGKYCSVKSGSILTVNKKFIGSGTPGNYFQFHSGTAGTQVNVNFPQGNVCLDYLMVQDINATGSNISAGANSFDLGNNTGWLFSPCTNISDVWPGDANYDLTANNVDVLNIGLAYGDTGAVRAGASNNWIAQPATDWSNFFQSAVNKKHADSDGNGVVDNNDTLAISLNYGLTHPARLADPNSTQSTSPPFYLIANPDTVMEGDTVEVEIYLGTQLIPVDSIYGIAFTINFDTALVDTSWMPFDFTGSWMGTPGVDLLTYDKKLFSQGKADVALTRTDHTNIGGYGYLGKMGAVIVDNVGTRLTTAPPYVTLPLSISNVTALTATEFYLSISTGTENVEIDTLGMTGIHSSPDENSRFSVYPNPVHKMLNIFSYWLKGETNCTFELYDVMGEKIISKQVPVSQNRFSMDVSNVSQGMYFIKVSTAKGTVNKKILVVKK